MKKTTQAAHLLQKPSGMLVAFMPTDQRAALMTALSGEGGDAIADRVLQVAETIRGMPQTFDTEGQEAGTDAMAYLHYYGGNADAWITQKDRGDPDRGDLDQVQAFGKLTMVGNSEGDTLSYISLEELIRNGIELDLYWVPVALSQCNKEGLG